MQDVTSRNDHAQTGSGYACVRLANFSNKILTVPKVKLTGIAEVSENLVDKMNAGNETNLTESTKPPTKRKNEALYDKLLRGKLDHLSKEERQQ